jgi:hypothetical protein
VRDHQHPFDQPQPPAERGVERASTRTGARVARVMASPLGFATCHVAGVVFSGSSAVHRRPGADRCGAGDDPSTLQEPAAEPDGAKFAVILHATSYTDPD